MVVLLLCLRLAARTLLQPACVIQAVLVLVPPLEAASVSSQRPAIFRAEALSVGSGPVRMQARICRPGPSAATANEHADIRLEHLPQERPDQPVDSGRHHDNAPTVVPGGLEVQALRLHLNESGNEPSLFGQPFVVLLALVRVHPLMNVGVPRSEEAWIGA
jgi:hypothetical protein